MSFELKPPPILFIETMSTIPFRPNLGSNAACHFVSNVESNGCIVILSNASSLCIFDALVKLSPAINFQVFEVYNNQLYNLSNDTSYGVNPEPLKNTKQGIVYNIDNMEQYQEIYDILERKRSAKRGHFIIRVMTG